MAFNPFWDLSKTQRVFEPGEKIDFQSLLGFISLQIDIDNR